MRLKGSIIVFFLTLTSDIALADWRSLGDWLWPSFSKCEVEILVGKRVRNRHTDKFQGWKCADDGTCARIKDGERGTVIGFERVRDGGYFIVVRWDEPDGSQTHLSYFGRYSLRDSLLIEH